MREWPGCGTHASRYRILSSPRPTLRLTRSARTQHPDAAPPSSLEVALRLQAPSSVGWDAGTKPRDVHAHAPGRAGTGIGQRSARSEYQVGSKSGRRANHAMTSVSDVAVSGSYPSRRNRAACPRPSCNSISNLPLSGVSLRVRSLDGVLLCCKHVRSSVVQESRSPSMGHGLSLA